MKGTLFAAALLAFALGLVGPVANASDDHPNLDASAIRAQQTQIQQEVRTRQGRYQNMTEEKRSELFAHQAKVDRLTSGITLTTELAETDQIALFNALEAIEGIVNRAEDDRMVCERHKPVGSNRPKTVCKTVAERRAEREAAQADVQRRNQTCFKDPSGNCI